MDIRLELVAGDRRMAIYDLGLVEAPRTLSGFALPRAQAHAMIAAVQQACAGLREEALRATALDLCKANPQIRLKDYRRRNVATLFGTLAVRVPRLLDRRTGARREVLLDETRTDHQGLSALLARLGAWMSYRYAAGFLTELFPLAGKPHPERIRRATLTVGGAQGLAAEANSADVEDSKRIDLSLDTTFLRSHDRSRGRQHEVLIGHGRSTAGRRQVIGTLLKHNLSSERVSACLAELGRTTTTEVTAFTDGDKVLRMLLKQCGVTERPILDWEHIARKLERLKIIARGFRPRFRRERGIKARILATLDRINWRLWHGQLEAALNMINRRDPDHAPGSECQQGATAAKGPLLAQGHPPATRLYRRAGGASGRLRRAAPGRAADRYRSDRKPRQQPGQQAHEQIAADALVSTGRASHHHPAHRPHQPAAPFAASKAVWRMPTPTIVTVPLLFASVVEEPQVDVIVYLATRHFGFKALGALYGGLLVVLSLGTAIGPLAAAGTFDRTGNYGQFF